MKAQKTTTPKSKVKRRPKAFPFDEAVMRLDGASEPGGMTLAGLNDLDQTQLGAFQKMWRTLDDDRRATIARSLHEFALADIEVDFTAIFKLGLTDADARVRAVSAEGLWELDDPSLIAPLLNLLRHDPVPAVRASAAQTLGHFMYLAEVELIGKQHHAEIFSALLETVRRAPEDSPLYQRALESIGHGAGESIDVDFYLRNALAADDTSLRTAGVIGMGRSGNLAYQALVRAELGHVSPALRREAAVAAGELEDADAVRPLGELIDDPEPAVQYAALFALAQIGGLDAKRLLDETSASADEGLKEQADEALVLYDVLHGQFDFNMQLFDEQARTSFHTIETATTEDPAEGEAPNAQS